MKLTEIKELYPNIEIEESEDGLKFSGSIEDVEKADIFMDSQIPNTYRRGMLAVFYETGTALRTYRRDV